MKVKDRIKSSTGNLKADIRKVLGANLEREARRALGKKSQGKSGLTVINQPWGAVYSGKPSAIVATFGAKPEHFPTMKEEGQPFTYEGRRVRLGSANRGRVWEAFVEYSPEDLDRSAKVEEAKAACTRAVEMVGAVFYAIQRINPEPLSGKLKVKAEVA